MILPQTAAPQEPAVKVEASLPAAEPQAVLPATEVAPAEHSAVAIWIVLVAVLASVAGLIFLKKKKLTA